MGLGDVGCYGGTQGATPNIDRMAREGTRLTQYYSGSPICSPSRAALLTGTYPARWRITSFLQTRAGNRGCEQADYLDTNAPSLPRALKAGGYATMHVGKWHLGGGRDVTNAPPFAAYGYDEHVGTYESPQPHPDITGTNWIWSKHDKVKRWERIGFFVDKTVDFLRRHKGQPCFINLWPDDVHTPWVPNEDAPRGDAPKNFRAVLAEYDRQIGRLFDALRAEGIDTNTLAIFTSDNGALPTFKGARSGQFRGSKLSLYEGGIRVPFIVRWPGHTPAGKVDDVSVLTALDLFPSLCARAGVPLPREATLDGRNLSRVFTNGLGSVAAAPMLWEYGRNEQFFKYPPGADRSPNLAVRHYFWKFLINADGSGAELYNLHEDPSETRNIVGQRSEIAESLKAKLLAWRRSMPRD
jgi:arylsulfatase A-like enzyme